MSTASTTTNIIKIIDAIDKAKASDAIGVAAMEALERITIAETNKDALTADALSEAITKKVMNYTGGRHS